MAGGILHERQISRPPGTTAGMGEVAAANVTASVIVSSTAEIGSCGISVSSFPKRMRDSS